MTKHSLNGVLRNIRKVAAVHTTRELSDGELLERFVGSHDETAFTVLIERHGPMVLGVCARVLPNFHDAEDACQATFLVLARKAASIRKQSSLGSWLHGVARRVAVCSKRAHARRQVHERNADSRTVPDFAAEVTWREVQGILDDELQRLPERYRAPLILCYLECMTRDEAAKQLGLAASTLHGRLERARELLRAGLTKRGLTLAAAMSAAAFGDSFAQAALSPVLVVASTKAAMMLAGGRPLVDGIVANQVLTLSQEVLRNMFITKLKLATATVMCAGILVALVAGSLISFSNAQTPPGARNQPLANLIQANESDTEFIHRISKDLRGTEPTPAEVHFFVSSKDSGRRQKLIDLFIQERQTRKTAALPSISPNPGKDPVAKQGGYATVPPLVQAKPSTKNNGQNPNIAGNAETRSVFTPVPAPKQASPIGGPDGVQVRVRVTGEIVKVLAKSGADVKKGDLLLQIESPQYKANLAAAQATVDEAKATMALVDANTRRTQELANKGVVSTAELDKARFELDRARANVRFAEAKAELARLSLDATSVRAPVDGKIGAILVTEGTHAIADQTILVIVQSKAEAK